MTNETPASNDPPNWRKMLSEMQEECQRLHQEIAQLQTERDKLAQALIALLPRDETVCEDEILAQIGHEKPLREFLQELRAELTKE